jgi:thiamine-phosphate pyrophosphorylase
MPSPFRICYITDRISLQPKPLLPQIVAAINAGVDLVQIREKDLGPRDLGPLVSAALAAARGTSTRIIVNERVDVALAWGAHGAHLGTRSIPASAVRSCTPADFLVGVSCHSLAEARDAESAGADYIVLGPVFPTPSKSLYGPPLGIEKFAEITRRLKVPVLALGGISKERVKACLQAGARGIAGIRIFQECDSLESLVKELTSQFAL